MADRLVGLLRHYSLSMRVFHSDAFCEQHHHAAPCDYIHLVRRGPITARSPVHEDLLVTEPSLLFYLHVAPHRFVAAPGDTAKQLYAKVDLGASTGNPLAMALSSVLLIPLADLPGLGPTLELLFAEVERDQCGRQAAIDRLCELLLIQLLCYPVDGRLGATGLLAGLADPKLARAIIAMHDAPQTAWSLKVLAVKAGMLRTRFAAALRGAVGVTSGDYLVDWRMDVSCTPPKQGRPVAVAANRVGYGSPNTLVRAFRVRTGRTSCNWLAQQRGDTALSGS